jgi:hypothetical protein
MRLVQHIRAIVLLENGRQRNSQEENEIKIKISCFVDSCIGGWAIKTNF